MDNPSSDAEFDTQGSVSTIDLNQIETTETDGFGLSRSEQGLSQALFDEDSAGGCEVFECLSINEDAKHRPNHGPIRNYRYAVLIGAEQDLLVIGAQVVTGNQIGRNSLSVWNSSDGFPGIKESEGSWLMHPALRWQGTFFSKVTAIRKGEFFWIIWEPVSGSEGTIAFSGVGVESLYQAPGGPLESFRSDPVYDSRVLLPRELATQFELR